MLGENNFLVLFSVLCHNTIDNIEIFDEINFRIVIMKNDTKSTNVKQVQFTNNTFKKCYSLMNI